MKNTVENMDFLSVASTVSGSAGAAITVTVGAGSYWASGTQSIIADRLFLKNNQTGAMGTVSNVNKTTANAHTFLWTPSTTTTNLSVTAGDELLSMGFFQIGGSSDVTQTRIPTVGRYSNYNTELRWDSALDDLAMMEKIEFSING
jgi:hypothetical protein